MENRELASAVRPKRPTHSRSDRRTIPCVCYDFGVKRTRCDTRSARLPVTVVPAATPRTKFLLSTRRHLSIQWSGDPASMNKEVEQIKELVMTSVPTFGICFGHQLLGRAFGGKTFKLTFGHRGGNQPVQDLKDGGVEITSHNHGFAVAADSLPSELEVTHINLNDRCVEQAPATLPSFPCNTSEAAPDRTCGDHFQRSSS